MDPFTVFLLVLLAVFVVRQMNEQVDRHRRAKLDKERGPQPICGCKDHYAFHDPESGHCHATRRIPVQWDDIGAATAWKQEQCGCRQYVGPQPLDTFYAPEITGNTTIRPSLNKADDDREER